MLRRDVQLLEHIADYCEDIRDCMERISYSRECFDTDVVIQHSVSFCILQIGELVGKLSEELRSSTAKEISWQEIRGMRNVVVHNYGEIKLSVV